jgi:hypothetical protein
MSTQRMQIILSINTCNWWIKWFFVLNRWFYLLILVIKKIIGFFMFFNNALDWKIIYIYIYDASETTYIIGRLICSFSHNIISCFGSFHSLRPSPLPKKKRKNPDEDNGVGRFFSFPINAFFCRLYNGIDMMILFYNGWTCWETSMVGLENFLLLWTSQVF